MAKGGKMDGLLFGLLLGGILVMPSIGTWIVDFLGSIVPSTWDWFGQHTLKVIVVALAGVVGWIVDMSN